MCLWYLKHDDFKAVQNIKVIISSLLLEWHLHYFGEQVAYFRRLLLPHAAKIGNIYLCVYLINYR